MLFAAKVKFEGLTSVSKAAHFIHALTAKIMNGKRHEHQMFFLLIRIHFGVSW
jgi:hypothetical protein